MTLKGERRGLNPRMVDPQTTALTTWPHPPILIILEKINLEKVYLEYVRFDLDLIDKRISACNVS